ncbi:hypothetical protein AQUCO_01200176v1 [Aquilegia coerulea]|uniref:Uncharacterized protein n=1 Tax=Aquilegia coerulea TaxID=218851 RepID=A0A2G5E4S4_AQUCA|nr:hypothetical protein AQUCO_01200176v1 [Aquilegia coerulea]
MKNLSCIDDQYFLRNQLPAIFFYRNNVAMKGSDPVKVIKEAISKALVYYYPFAGRLREAPNNKLTVECTGEGVIFVEASANVSLHQFGDFLYPPFPCIKDLLYAGPASGVILHSPLLLFQVIDELPPCMTNRLDI